MERLKREGHSDVLLALPHRLERALEYDRQRKECTPRDMIATLVNSRRGFVVECGVNREGSVVRQVDGERVVEVDVQAKKVLGVNGIEHAQVLDLSDEGERWEGDVLDGIPYGWGVLYDSENRMVYEGFRIGDVNVCYGMRYYSDVGVMEYEGEWCNGKRWGRGVQYDRKGDTVFDGEWLNDDRITESMRAAEMNTHLSTIIETLTMGNNYGQEREWTVFDLSLLFNLVEVTVGDECFWYVTEVKLVGLDRLKKVSIGRNSFGVSHIIHRIHSQFCLKDCSRITELRIGAYSCSNYRKCVIENVPSLASIQIGELGFGESVSFMDSDFELRSDCWQLH